MENNNGGWGARAAGHGGRQDEVSEWQPDTHVIAGPLSPCDPLTKVLEFKMAAGFQAQKLRGRTG